MDQKMNVYIWDMDETLILLKSLLNGTYVGAFNGLKNVQNRVEIGKMWEDHILQVCDSYFFYEQMSFPFLWSIQILCLHKITDKQFLLQENKRIRKLLNTIGFVVASFALMALPRFKTLGGVVFCSSMALGFLALGRARFAVNHIDVAPRYAGIGMGVSNTVCTLAGIMGLILLVDFLKLLRRMSWISLVRIAGEQFLSSQGHFLNGHLTYERSKWFILFTIESLFKTHPNGCLIIESSSMDSRMGMQILRPFLDNGFKMTAISPDFNYLFNDTAATQAWYNQLMQGNVYPGEVSLGQNLSNLLRLGLLYKFGGIYLDTDILVLKSFKRLRNTIGAQTINPEIRNWSRLNNVVMIFDKGHPLLYKFIEG